MEWFAKTARGNFLLAVFLIFTIPRLTTILNNPTQPPLTLRGGVEGLRHTTAHHLRKAYCLGLLRFA